MKIKNLQDEIEVTSHEGSRIIVTRKKKENKAKFKEKHDVLDMVIINVSIVIGIFLVIAGVNLVVGGYVSEIPSMLGIG